MKFFYLITLQWMDADNVLCIETFDGVITLPPRATPSGTYSQVWEIARQRAKYRGIPAVLLYQLTPDTPMNPTGGE